MLNSISRGINKSCYFLKDHLPEILALTGSITSTVAIIFTVKKSNSGSKIIEEHKTEIRNAEIANEDEKELKKEKRKIYLNTSVQFAKEYYPAVILEGISILSTISGARIGRNKLNGTLAAAATMQSIHNAYRQNVVAKYGEEADKELRYGLMDTSNYLSKDGKSVTLTNADGKKIKVTENNFDKDISKIFDETNINYVRDAHYNKDFIRSTEQWANRRLKQKGFVFLNEVYEQLGFESTALGHEIGWVYKDKSLDDVRKHNNYICIRTIDAYGNKALDFENGIEPSVILDFNVDGYIASEIKWGKS